MKKNIGFFLLLYLSIINYMHAQHILYGVTLYGGNNNQGLIFKMSSDGNDFQKIHSLNSIADGEEIWGSLFLDNNNLFGLSFKGGQKGAGTVFKISSNGDFHVLRHLDSIADGKNPMGSLMKASNGFIYGMANNGGANKHGTIFRLKPDGTDFSVLKHFLQSTDGKNPYGRLVQGTDNKLYGMTPDGGSGGIIFRLNLDGTGFEIIKELQIIDGQSPFGSLIFSSGILYGMTRVGGSLQGNTGNAGTIFSLNPENLEFKVLHPLSPDLEGGNSYGGLIESSSGLLVGMTRNFGPLLFGTIFTLKKDGGDFKIIHQFNGATDGGYPRGDLIEAPDGTLFGMTFEGGAFNAGTLFKIKLDGSGFTVLKNFNPSTDGKNPRGSLVLGDLITGLSPTSNEELTIYPNPSNGDVNINSKKLIHELSIYDVTGKEIASSAMIKQYKLNLAPGLYIFRINENGQLKSRKVIVTD